ncbi:ATP-grasp domain-containing protein [Streptomyces sp. NRRL S-350]|uniref:ATP-grasp domain-containing protein n=1 Tax=Streptomyces sp. NRRL S-350 TaxID=1463902 RepID=UPI0004C21FC4|nr:ATP-grasp domain-containing protein [Streptomyces sp. NRRL S-350]
MRIAVVDGFSTSRILVRQLAEHAVECVHLRTQPAFRDSYTRGFDPGAYAVDLGHLPEDDAVAALRRLGVDQVIAGGESGVVLADTLGHRLGLPGNDVRTAPARRDKARMAALLRAAGLAAPSGTLASSADEAATWFTANGGTVVVVKPLASAATDGVRICGTAAEVREAAEDVLGRPNFIGAANRAVLVQDYLEGDEYIVNTVSRDGVHKVAEILRCAKNKGPYGSPVYDFHEPVQRSDPRGEEVVAYTKEAVTALGIAHGAAHSEVMLTPSGPVLIETGARLMGSIHPWVHEKYLGTSHVHLYALALTDPEAFKAFPDEDLRWSHELRQVYLFNHRAGVAGSDAWQERYRSLESFVELSAPLAPGQAVPQTVDLATVPGYVYLAAQSSATVDRDRARIRAYEDQGVYVRR